MKRPESHCSNLLQIVQGARALTLAGKELAKMKQELSKKEFRLETAHYKGVRQMLDWAVVFGHNHFTGDEADGVDFPVKLFSQKHISAIAAEIVDDDGEVQEPLLEGFLTEFYSWAETFLDDPMAFSKKKADIASICDDFLNKVRKGWWNGEATSALRKAGVYKEYKHRVKEAAELIAGDEILSESHVKQAIKEVEAELPKLKLGNETIEIKIDEPPTLPLSVVGQLIERHSNNSPMLLPPAQEKPVFAPQLNDARILQLEKRIEELQGQTSLDAEVICSLKERIREIEEERNDLAASLVAAPAVAKKDLSSLIKEEAVKPVGQLSLFPSAVTPAPRQSVHSAPVSASVEPAAITDEEAKLQAEAMGLRMGEIYQLKSTGSLVKVKRFFAKKSLVMVAGDLLEDGAPIETRADWLAQVKTVEAKAEPQ